MRVGPAPMRRHTAPGRTQVRPSHRTGRRCRTDEPPPDHRETRGRVVPLETKTDIFVLNLTSRNGVLQDAPVKFLYRPSSLDRITSVERDLLSV